MSPGQIQTAHLDDTTLQGLADGSLRGPEGFEAREHCEACAACAAELGAPAALSIFAVVGWALSAGLVQRVNEILNGVALLRQVADVAAPVVEVARLPI